MLYCILLSHIGHWGLLPIKGPLHQEPLQNMVPSSPTIGTLVESSSHLDTCLKPKVAEVEIFSWMIKPGCPGVVDINTSSNIVDGGIWTRTKTSRPSSTRVRDSRGATKGTAQTLRSEVSVGAIERHGGKGLKEETTGKSLQHSLAFIPKTVPLCPLGDWRITGWFHFVPLFLIGSYSWY
jgi:hypothetical protein